MPDYNGFVGVLDSTGRVSLLSAPSTLAVFYNGRDLASVTDDRVFIFSNTQGQQAESSGSQDNALPGAMTRELQLNFTPRSVLMIRENLLIVGSEYPDASVYILAPGASPLRIPLTSSVYALAPANDGFYVGGSDVEKFDFSGNLIWKYETHSTVNSLSSKGNLVAVGALSGIYLLSSEGEKLWGVSFPEDGFERDPLVSLEGDVVFATVIQRDGTWLWKIRNGKILWKEHVSGNMVLSLAVSDDGKYIAFGDIRGNIGIMDSNGSLIKTIRAGEGVNDLTILRKGEWEYLLARTMGGTVNIYLLPSGIQVDEMEAGSATPKPGVSLSVSPDGGSVALLGRASDGGVLRVLPLPNLQNIALLSVESTPPGAIVVVDGHYEGRTPINVTVSPGNHTIKTTLPGYAPAGVILSLMPQKHKTVHLKLVKDGFLTVDTSPSGVRVYLNRTYVGTTPLEGYAVSPGTYSLVLRKEGYMEYTKTIIISSGNETRISASLQPLSPVTTSSESSNHSTHTSQGVETTGKTSGEKSTSENNLRTTGTIKPVIAHSNEGRGNSTRANASITLYIGIALAVLILSVVVFKLTKKKTKETFGLDFPSALLPRYEPIEFLGEGGFAKVFKAKRKKDGKVVALKIPRIDEKTSKTFIREVSTWLHLNHPNIVKLYDVDILPVPYLEMEYVEGITLNGKTVRDLDAYLKPVDEKTALNLIKGIAEGLRHAHSKGVYHRDLKPLNILLKSDLRPKITDWGLAKLGTMGSSRSVMGYTPLYAAPEHLMPGKYGHTDHRTDIWQLGVTFYELLTGRLPFEGYTYEEVFGKIVDEDYKFTPPSKINPELAKYDGIFERLLAKRKEDRYQSVDDFLNDLKNLEESEKRKAELEVEVEKLKKSLSESMTALKKSTSAEEIMRNRRIVVETLGKLALTYAELNRKAELLNTLNDLKFYTVQNLRDLSNAINTAETLFKEELPVPREFIERLKVLIHNIKRENGL